MKPDSELKALAIDIRAGQVFTDRQIRHPESELGMVFMPLLLMDQKTADGLKADGADLFYEYVDKAGPRSINGYPCFFSVRFLTAPERERVWEHMVALKEAEETAGMNQIQKLARRIARKFSKRNKQPKEQHD